MSAFYDLEGQRKRRNEAIRLQAEKCRDHFDAQGRWQRDGQEPSPLIKLSVHCLPLLAAYGERHAGLVDAIIRETGFVECQFAPTYALFILQEFGQLLNAESQSKLLAYVEEWIDDFNAQKNDFVGVNDNFPLGALYTVLFGGKRLNRPDVVQTGVCRLDDLVAMLRRRGVITEYNSPSYTVHSIFYLAAIANHTEDEEIRRKALLCEERLWVDFLGHLYLPAGQLAGPYSRAYLSGLTSAGNIMSVLYSLLGDRLNEAIGTQEGDELHIRTTYSPSELTEHHCPAYLVEWALNRTYPIAFKASTEYNACNDEPSKWTGRDPHAEDDLFEYASGSGLISTYMTEDYSIGVSTNEFHNGIQTESFYVAYPRRKPIRNQGDVGRVFAKYVINGKKPGQENDSGRGKLPAFLFADEGRKIGVHHERTAMMLYKPKPSFFRERICSLRLMITFSIKDGDVEELWLGERRLQGLSGDSVEPCPIFVKDGDLYFAFHPLLLTDYGREKAIRVEKLGDFLCISLYNYEGPERSFKRRGYALTGNGFVAEVGSASEYGSFPDFRSRMLQAAVRDTHTCNIHIRETVTRIASYTREDVSLACEYSPASEGIRYMAVNGWVLETPKLEASGLDLSKVPYMKEAERQRKG